MSSVTATTASDFLGPVRQLPRLEDAPGTTLELLVLAADGQYCAGVDLASGVLVRAWSPEPLKQPLRSYDTATMTLAAAIDCVPDPTEPEGLPLIAPPEPTGRLTGRKAERLLRPLVHPSREPLLGVHAPAVPFWERRPDRPSIALVEPHGPALLVRSGSYLSCRFPWRETIVEFPCLDRRAAAEMDRTGRARMATERSSRLLIALNPPINGHCHKVVESVLPRP